MTHSRAQTKKDHDNLIKVLARLVEQEQAFSLVLVSTGLDKRSTTLVVQLDAAGLRERIHLLGPTSDVPAVMNALDVHVLSSSAEAFPNVLAEAMACGTPCVTTDVGDAALIVGDTGWVVPPKDSAALAQAMVTAIEAWRDRGAWTRRQAACRARIAEHFSIDAMVERYRAVWDEVALRLSQ